MWRRDRMVTGDPRPELAKALADLPAGSVGVLGLPWDGKSSFLRGSAAAPAFIRQALFSSSTNTATESGLDLRDEPRLRLLGDLDLPVGEAAFATIERGVAAILEQGSRVLCLGGDHSVTLPVVRAQSRHSPDLNIVHLDAHSDSC